MTPLRQRMLDAMQLRGLAVRTQQAYVDAVASLARHYGCSPHELNQAQVQDYLIHLIRERSLATSSVNQAGSAFRFFYGTVLLLERQIARRSAAPEQLRTARAGALPLLEAVEAAIGQAHHVGLKPLEQRHAQLPLAARVRAQIGTDDGMGRTLGQQDAARLRVARPALPALSTYQGAPAGTNHHGARNSTSRVEIALDSALVSTDPEIMSGALCFAGTRVPVKNLLDYLGGSSSLEDFLDDFPSVSRERAVGVLEAARASLADAAAA